MVFPLAGAVPRGGFLFGGLMKFYDLSITRSEPGNAQDNVILTQESVDGSDDDIIILSVAQLGQVIDEFKKIINGSV